MALALKCDICGAYYDHYNSRYRINEWNEVANTIIIKQKELNGVTLKTKEFDLCPECLNKIFKILNKED